ncbi:MAG: amino acid permease [Methanosarcinales archaeon]|nr:amino acid permease [Methanosarcinales archaeon]
MSQKIELKRELGLLEATLAGVGVILGAGIYALIGQAAGLAGNSVWISFGLASLIAVFTGLSYAELSSMYPKASAEYEYTNNAFGSKLAFIIGWLIIFSGVVGASAVALGFAGYFNVLFDVPLVYSAVVLILILSFILFHGIKESARVAIIFTLIEAGGLILIFIIGIPFLGHVDYLDMPHGFKGIFEASALIFFAFIGFEGVVRLSEETRNPEKNIPRALILALIISIILYMAVAFSTVSVVGWEKLSQSDAPFATVAFEAMGNNAFILLSVIALFATANTVLLMLLGASRMVYGMADSFSLPNTFAKVHPGRRTPWIAIFTVTILSILFLFTGNIAFLANVTNYTLFLTFIVINAAIIWLRYKEPQLTRPFRIPINIGNLPLLPIIGLVSCLFMLLQMDISILIIGVLLTIVGGVLSLVDISEL